jgi:multiple sugar transport system ATP-binding protein
MARVAFENIYKRFNKVEVVHDVSIDVKDKEFLSLLALPVVVKVPAYVW